jgi:hypothetical protein
MKPYITNGIIGYPFNAWYYRVHTLKYPFVDPMFQALKGGTWYMPPVKLQDQGSLKSKSF